MAKNYEGKYKELLDIKRELLLKDNSEKSINAANYSLEDRAMEIFAKYYAEAKSLFALGTPEGLDEAMHVFTILGDYDRSAEFKEECKNQLELMGIKPQTKKPQKVKEPKEKKKKIEASKKKVENEGIKSVAIEKGTEAKEEADNSESNPKKGFLASAKGKVTAIISSVVVLFAILYAVFILPYFPYSKGLAYSDKGDTISVSGIGSFTGSNLIIPSEIYGKKVTAISNNAFMDCENLKSITIPDSVTRIGSYAFKGCINLKSISIPNNVTNIEDTTFFGCTSLTSIDIPNSVTSIGWSAFADCKNLEKISLSNNLTSINHSAFSGCENISEISIPNSVTQISASAFRNCTSLTNIDVSGGITTISDSMFEGCTSLTRITLPDSLTHIGKSAFENCTSLASINIPVSVTNIGSWAFENCKSLATINYSGDEQQWDGIYKAREWNSNTGVYKIIYASHNNSNQYLQFEQNEYDSGYTVKGIVGLNVTEITIPSMYNGQPVTQIGSSAFSDWTSLKKIVISDTVTTIGSSAFFHCTSLKEIVIPDSVVYISNSAFKNCTNLISITIPKSVVDINAWAFSNCGNLTYIKYCGDEDLWISISKNALWDDGANNYTIIYNCED